MDAVGPGDKVECIRDDWWCYNNEACPVKGSIYIIRNFYTAINGTIGYRFIEIINPPHLYLGAQYVESAFTPSWFRPIRDDKTDITIFQEIVDRELNPDRLVPQKKELV